MAKVNVPKVAPKNILPNTPEMESFLQVGYPDMSVEKAHTIIKERKENPNSWPYEMLEKAHAFLEAYSQAPKAVSNKKPMVKVEQHFS